MTTGPPLSVVMPPTSKGVGPSTCDLAHAYVIPRDWPLHTDPAEKCLEQQDFSTLLGASRLSRHLAPPETHPTPTRASMGRKRTRPPSKGERTMTQPKASDQVLLINDMCGYGKVALAAMLPVLSHMGFRIHNLPTAIVSDTLDYPEFYIQDLTDYVNRALEIWGHLGFEFDAISTGFIVTEEQATRIAAFCEERAARGTRVFVDPIMGDNGSLYAGVPESTIGHMRRLVAVADCTVPNYTEACLLTDTPMAPAKEGITRAEADALVDKIREVGAKSVVVTSSVVDGQHAVVGYDHLAGERFLIPFDEIPVYFPGTGDIFSSVLMGRVLQGRTLADATSNAMDAVRQLIYLNQEQKDKAMGLPVEKYLSVVDR